MSTILLWIGIAVIVLGWLSLGWQALRQMSEKDALDRFSERNRMARLRRNYCRLTILLGILLVLLALAI